MHDFSSTHLLWTVNAYVLLIVTMLVLSADDLRCRVRGEARCARRRQLAKFFVAIPLILTVLGILAFGLFAIGMAHGSRPENYQVILFIAACLLLILLLAIWVYGSIWIDAICTLVIIAAAIYLIGVKPALYVRVWADDHYAWAQMWMAEHYAAGSGGLKQSEPTARSWYARAAENGSVEAQFMMGLAQKRSKNVRKWYEMAAAQGHADSMIQLARMSSNDAERQQWITRAAEMRHPDAFFLQARDLMNSDLKEARRLSLKSAELGSRQAMVLLIDQYQHGGVLFDRDERLAERWKTRLGETPPSAIEPKQHPWVSVTPEVDGNEAARLYRLARQFLNHPAKDEILHERALRYLTQAAEGGNTDAALELARLSRADTNSPALNDDALKWYELAARHENEQALAALTAHYKRQDKATVASLEMSLSYNARLLNVMQQDPENTTRRRLRLQHWSGEYRDTQKQLEQLKRLGGSWEQARARAQTNPDDAYALAQELLSSRLWADGMEQMASAARRGNPDARLYLATRTLRGPRSFEQEISAIAELQALDREGFKPASLDLGMWYQSNSGLVPKNLYLTRQLFQIAATEPDLTESAERLLNRLPALTDDLVLQPGQPVAAQIDDWYEQSLSTGGESALLTQQYDNLKIHFEDTTEYRLQAQQNNALAQYRLAQVLQSHDLGDAVMWLNRAAENGNSDAQYELAVRMIRGKKNSPQTNEAIREWANAAADSGHTGAMIFLAVQYRTGNAVFKKDDTLAQKYYRKALTASEGETIFSGRIAGRPVSILRTKVIQQLEKLQNSASSEQ